MIERFRNHSPDLAPGAWVHAAATVIGQVKLGKNVSVWPAAVLRGDMGRIDIGDNSNIQDGAVAHMTDGASNCVIGERVTVGHRAILHGCIVGNDCLIGMGAILLDNCVIPDGCVVGAGALVTGGKTFEPGSLILGSPAKAVKKTGPNHEQWIAYSWKHYLETAIYYDGHPGLAGG